MIDFSKMGLKELAGFICQILKNVDSNGVLLYTRTIPASNAANDVQVSSSRVYTLGYSSQGANAMLWISDLNGSAFTPITLFSSINSTALGVALSENKVYIAGVDTIDGDAYLCIRNYDGSGSDNIVLLNNGSPGISADYIGRDTGNIFWTSGLNGQNITETFLGIMNRGIAIDNSVYLSSSIGGQAALTIAETNLSSSQIIPVGAAGTQGKDVTLSPSRAYLVGNNSTNAFLWITNLAGSVLLDPISLGAGFANGVGVLLSEEEDETVGQNLFKAIQQYSPVKPLRGF